VTFSPACIPITGEAIHIPTRLQVGAPAPQPASAKASAKVTSAARIS
jgi:hypothetical protein